MMLSDFAVACIAEGAQQQLLEENAALRQRIEELEQENRELRSQLAAQQTPQS